MLQSASLIVVRLTDTPYMQNIAVFKKIYVYLSTFQYKWHALVKIWEIFFFIEKENSTNTQNFLKQSFSAGIICTELNSRAYLCIKEYSLFMLLTATQSCRYIINFYSVFFLNKKPNILY